MAERRMFTSKVTDSDAFTEMPPTAQCLYFHMCMTADDDGFCDRIRSSLFASHASTVDFEILVKKRFIIPFDSGVVVIKHWRMHNIIKNDRYHETKYIEEKAALVLKENGAYTESGSNVDPTWNQLGTNMEPEVRLGKESIGKDSSVNKGRFTPPSVEEVTAYIKEKGYHFDPEQFVSFYESKNWMVGKNKMASWEKACVTWEIRWKENHAGEKPPKRNARPAENHDYDFDDIEAMLIRKQKEWK